jgi:hypothetical protein
MSSRDLIILELLRKERLERDLLLRKERFERDLFAEAKNDEKLKQQSKGHESKQQSKGHESKQQFNSHNVSNVSSTYVYDIVGNVLYAKESYIVALFSVITWKMAPCLRTSAYGPAVWRMASCLRTSASGPAVDSKHSAVAVAKYELTKALVEEVIASSVEEVIAPAPAPLVTSAEKIAMIAKNQMEQMVMDNLFNSRLSRSRSTRRKP